MTRDREFPTVSIGLPVYNGERYLALAIDSILSQTFEDFELIISDNGSTDRTAEICREYARADSRIVVHHQAQNMGGAWNFNAVFRAARGEHFKWACYDDIMHPRYLECCVPVMEEHPDVVVCYPRTLMIDEHGQNPTPYDDDMHLLDDSPVERFRGVLFRRSMRCNPHLGLIRRAALARTDVIGAYKSSDEVLMAHLALLGKYYEYPEALSYRRRHPNASVQANPTARAIYSWYDPNHRGRIYLPTVRHFREYLRAVRRSDISVADKIGCARLAFRKFRWSRHLLAQELKANVRAVSSIGANGVDTRPPAQEQDSCDASR